jgi:lipopolysaccharide transport system ATP-binding protein
MHSVEFRDVSKYFALDSQRASSFQETLIDVVRRRPSPPERGLWALRDVNFAVEPGESIAFIGVNGSGKSTILKLISRVITPTRGDIVVRGRVTALLELGAGFHPDLTGRENIDLNGSILGLSRASIREQFDDIVAFSELERFIDVPVRSYSSGMLMRLGFAVATAFQPDILLIDEVLAVGDQAFQDRCLHRIAQIQHRGATIVLVSHDLESVGRLCKRAIWVHEGRLQGDGPTSQITSRYLIRLWDQEQRKFDGESAGRAAAVADDQRLMPAARPEPDEPESQKGPITGELEAPARWGSGEVRIEKVELLDGVEGTTRVFRTGGTFKVRIWYTAPQRVEHPAFGISLYDEEGNRINGPNTTWAKSLAEDGEACVSIGFIVGSGIIDYTADHFPLLPGRYDLTVAVYDEFVVHPYDHWHRMLTFTVIPGDVERQDGLCYISCRWDHAPTDLSLAELAEEQDSAGTT